MEAEITVTIKAGILDPEGKAILGALKNMGITGIEEVKTGKFLKLHFKNGLSRKRAEELAREACEKLLVNPNIETYHFKITGDKE